MKINHNNQATFTGELKLGRVCYKPAYQLITPADGKPFIKMQNIEEFTAGMPDLIKEKVINSIKFLNDKIKDLNLDLLLTTQGERVFNLHLYQKSPNSEGSFIFKCTPINTAIENIKKLKILGKIQTKDHFLTI